MTKRAAWILPLGVAAAIFWLSSRTRLPFDVALPHPLDKGAHASVFAVLAWTLDFALARTVRLSPSRRRILAFLLASAFGATDEWHQAYVPGRACEFGDWVADSAGAILGLALRGVLSRREERNEDR